MNPNDVQKIFKKQITGALISALIFPIVILIAFFIFLFVLSFTDILGGPYGIARFFFWFLTFIYGTVGYSIFKIIVSSRKKSTNSTPDDAGKVFRDAEIIDK